MTCADAISFNTLAGLAVAVFVAVAGPVGTYLAVRPYVRGAR